MKQNNPIKIDTHFHLDLFPQPEALAQQLQDAHIKVIAVTNTPSVFHYTYNLSKKYPVILPAIGLHPELTLERQHELPIMWDWLEKTRFIGEIGLDYVTTNKENRRVQREVFQSILSKCSSFGDKIITVHSRRSSADVISVIGENYPGKVILHWFSGNVGELQKAISFGFYFSVNSAMLRTQRGQDIIRRIPHERILIETDGPFIKIDSTPANPLYISNIVKSLSNLWNTEVDTTFQQISDNFNTVITLIK